MGASIVGLTLMGHLCTASEVPYDCFFLAVDESKGITGRELVIDGSYPPALRR
jgi:hypothetical protein